MPKYGFSLTRIFSYKDRIVDSVLLRENAGQRKRVLWHISCSDMPFYNKSLVSLIYQISWHKFPNYIYCKVRKLSSFKIRGRVLISINTTQAQQRWWLWKNFVVAYNMLDICFYHKVWSNALIYLFTFKRYCYQYKMQMKVETWTQ